MSGEIERWIKFKWLDISQCLCYLKSQKTHQSSFGMFPRESVLSKIFTNTLKWFEGTPGNPRATTNSKILRDTRVRLSVLKYSWTPACDSQFENTPGHQRATVNLNRLLDTRVRKSIRKYSWTPACDSQLENSPGPPRATVNLKIILDNRVWQ